MRSSTIHHLSIALTARVRVRILVAALALWPCVATASPVVPLGHACLVVSGLSGRDQLHCLSPDAVMELRTNIAHTQGAKPYAVDELRIPGRGMLFLSDEPGLKGRIWKVSGNANAARMAALGIPRNAIASAMMIPMACFYEHADFKGQERCFAPGDMVKRLPVLDRMISAIRLSPRLGVRTYTDNPGGGATAFFEENANWKDLQARNLNDAIRALQVARSALCTDHCLIPGTDAYDLRSIFGGAWSASAKAAPQISIRLEIAPDTNTVLQYGNTISVSHAGGSSAVNIPMRGQLPIALEPDPRVRYLTIAMSFRVKSSFDVQLIRSDADRRYIDATAITTFPWPAEADEVISLSNASMHGALVLNKAVADVASMPLTYILRDVECGNRPLLSSAIHDLSPCITGTAPPTSLPDNAPVLMQHYVNDRNPLAVAAAARTCRLQVERALSIHQRGGTPIRQRRVIGNWEACADRVTTIITLYQILFPDGWNVAQFKSVIRRVLDGGAATRQAGTDAQEAEFATAVRRQTEVEDTRLADAVLAFHQANVVKAYSISARLDLEPLAADPAELRAVACSAGDRTPDKAPDKTAGAPTTASHTLGWYRLDLSDNVDTIVVPRVMRNGIAAAFNEPFILSIVTRVNTDDVNMLRVQMYRWQQDYIRALLPPGSPEAASNRPAVELPASTNLSRASAQCQTNPAYSGRDFLASTGLSMTEDIDDALRHANADSVFVTIFFQGRPVAVLLGDVPNSGSTEAEIRMVVSAPENVLDPHREGAIRGAGAAAINYFIQYARSRQMAAIRTQAISYPAAKAFRKAGFRMHDEL